MSNKELTLTKTHDYCKSKKPQLGVVLIHGIASDSSTFEKALHYLEDLDALKNVRFITFDLLGSGKSLKSDELNYDYEEQLTALNNSIKDLKLNVPLILVGHSLGTFIVTRYASTFGKEISKLVLISPPVYTEADLDNPLFEKGMQAFKDAVSLKDRKILQEKAFNNSMKNVVLDRKNYKVLSGLKTPAVLIYGAQDQFISGYNIPALLKNNKEYLRAIETDGRHGVSQDKYYRLGEILEEDLNAENI
ncbi:alpha/beta fold hydrolase [Candidatus Saccharibacteria bacterium]|nr:alpha/beta fold hydrolase [Candidatus Saccharibacteria bacterium]